MSFNKEKFQQVKDAFIVDSTVLREIAAAFRYDIRKGLDGSDESSLRMLKSYVGLPSGKETGEFLALDFGGTNVRVLRIRLLGQGKFEVLKKVAKPLRVDGVYDYVGAGSAAKDMFDFIAGLVDEAIEGNHETKYLLGHTFSFPSEQTNLYNAKLIIWTKEFATAGVEGEVVNDLLKEALVRIGAVNVEPTAVINDTVAVLLAAAYKQEDTFIGSIYATGHNTCYLEPYAGKADEPMIINMDSGNFSKLIPNKYDQIIDESSEKPGEQRLEKMVSGRYMGELFGLALAEILGSNKKYAFTSIDMSNIVLDETDAYTTAAGIIAEKTGEKLAAADCALVQELALSIIVRSARIVTSTFAGIIWHLTGDGKVKKQHIAIDGSVYEKMPRVKENVMKALYDILGEDAALVDTVLENGGSGLGAAIAASMSQQ